MTKKVNWFEELSEVDQKIVMAIRRGSVIETGHPTEYERAVDLLFDLFESSSFCIH